MKILDIITESHNRCPHCGSPLVSESELMEKKDACYYKIKSSAKVWPSAYASGRLVQCRKKGAANYGNKSESVAEGKEDKIEQLKQDYATAVHWSKNETSPQKREASRQKAEKIKSHLEKQYKQGVAEGSLNEFAVSSDGDGDGGDDSLFNYAKMWYNGDLKTQQQVEKALQKSGLDIGENEDENGGAYISDMSGDYYESWTAEDLEQGVAEGENWSKHNNPRAGGMSKKSVSSYRRSHPGSKIQTAVTTKPSKLKKGSKAAKRRASFCARMRGMKKHRTGAKTARDPNSNINKSLRRWHCESIEELHELVMLAEQYIRNKKNEL